MNLNLFISEAIGSKSLDESCKKLLNNILIKKIQEIIKGAAIFMRHSSRNELIPDDIINVISPKYNYIIRNHLESKKYKKDTVDIPVQDVSLSLHWLTVDGTQPLISQNPKDLVKLSTSDSTHSHAQEIRPIISHRLSTEHRLYLDVLIRVFCDTNPIHIQVRDTISQSLCTDTGIQPLIPYLSQFLAEEIPRSLRSIPRVTQLLLLIRILFVSPNLNLLPYLHQFIPTLLTCCVTRFLGDSTENHWLLRQEAASILGIACKRYDHIYPELKPRVSRILIHALMDPRRSLTTHYGVLVALYSLGTTTFFLLVIPKIEDFYNTILQPAFKSCDHLIVSDAWFCWDIIVRYCGNFFQNELIYFNHNHCLHPFKRIRLSIPPKQSFVPFLPPLSELFGEAISPFLHFTPDLYSNTFFL